MSIHLLSYIITYCLYFSSFTSFFVFVERILHFEIGNYFHFRFSVKDYLNKKSRTVCITALLIMQKCFLIAVKVLERLIPFLERIKSGHLLLRFLRRLRLLG